MGSKGCFPGKWQGKNLKTFGGPQELEKFTQPFISQAGKALWQLCGMALQLVGLIKVQPENSL